MVLIGSKLFLVYIEEMIYLFGCSTKFIRSACLYCRVSLL